MQFASSARFGLGIRQRYHTPNAKTMTPDTFVFSSEHLIDHRTVQELFGDAAIIVGHRDQMLAIVERVATWGALRDPRLCF